jgi:hypothetical protein
LPLSNKFDCILVVKDHLIKLAHFIPCQTTIAAADTIQLFLNHIVRLHGFPETIISDRGPQFLCAFWKHFWNHFDTSPEHSTSFHPQSDGNMEIVNKLVIQYLCIYAHDNPSFWSQHLPLAESSY